MYISSIIKCQKKVLPSFGFNFIRKVLLHWPCSCNVIVISVNICLFSQRDSLQVLGVWGIKFYQCPSLHSAFVISFIRSFEIYTQGQKLYKESQVIADFTTFSILKINHLICQKVQILVKFCFWIFLATLHRPNMTLVNISYMVPDAPCYFS